MRRLIPLLVIVLAVPAFAQQENSFSIFVSNPGGGYSKTSGTYLNAGVGIDYQRVLTQRWSADVSVARETYPFSAFSATGGQQTLSSTVFPVDVTARYSFSNSGRWRPYAGAGLRYIHSSGDLFPAHSSRITPEILGGLAFRLTPRLSIFADVKQGLRNETGPRWDPLTKTSFGVRFSF